MFNIESYITPIILNYIGKYVEDFKPADFQMSLWNGEIKLQNIDLRLGVLEEEFQLPFELLSGHINELNIQVPWATLHFESVQITINTIEFILKIKSRKDADDGSASTSNSSEENVAKSSEGAIAPAQQSLLTQHSSTYGLMTQILHNIRIDCRNIILKCIDDDIVFSMNIQQLNVKSVDAEWNPTMLNLYGPNILIRKLIQIDDLTICLDNRNAAGQIDVYLEPIMYRCTLQCRILNSFNTNTEKTSSTTRIAVFTQALDMNLSNLQFPLLMRLIKTLLTLIASITNDEDVDDESGCNLIDPATDTNSTEYGFSSSLSKWLWSLVFTPKANDSKRIQPGHTKDYGIYLEEFNFSLKHTEVVSDPLMGGNKRLNSIPILRLTLGGVYIEKVINKELNWDCLRIGLSSLYVEPLEYITTNRTDNATLIESKPYTNNRSFLDKSLFDVHCQMAGDKPRIIINSNDYNDEITDEYLMYRSPIFVIDMIEYRAANKRRNSAAGTAAASSIGSNSLKSLNYQKQTRLLLANVSFRFNETILQVKNIINEFIDSYDYTAYSNADNKITKDACEKDLREQQECIQRTYTEESDYQVQDAMHASPTPQQQQIAGDCNELVEYTPTAIYRVTVTNCCLKLYAQLYPKANHDNHYDSGMHKLNEELLETFHYSLPFVELCIGKATACQASANVGTHLTSTASHSKDRKFLEHFNPCYESYEVKVQDISLSISNPMTFNKIKLLYIPNLNVYCEKLNEPNNYPNNDEMAVMKVKMKCQELNIDVSKRHLTAGIRLVQSIFSYQPQLLRTLTPLMNQPLVTADYIKLFGVFKHIHINYFQYHTYTIANVSLAGIRFDLIDIADNTQHEESHEKHYRKCNLLNTEICSKENSNLQPADNTNSSPSKLPNPNGDIFTKILNSDLRDSDNKWLEFHLQLPSNKEDAKDCSTAIALWLEAYEISVDSLLVDYLSFQENDANFSSCSSHNEFCPMKNKRLTNPLANTNYRKPINLNPYQSTSSSLTLNWQEKKTMDFNSAGKDEGLEKLNTSTNASKPTHKAKETTSGRLLKTFQRFNSLVISVEIAAGSLYIKPEANHSENQTVEMPKLCLPQILWKSSQAACIERSNLYTKIHPSKSNEKSNLNWTINFNDFSVKSSHVYVLEPWDNNVTVALTHKLKLNANDSKAHHSKIINTESNKNLEGSQALLINSKDNQTQMDVYALNVHLDSSVMKLNANHLYTFIQKINYLWLIHSLVKKSNTEAMYAAKDVDALKILTANEEDNSLKEFLDADNDAVAFKKSESLLGDLQTVFCQWTITKIAMRLSSSDNRAMILDLEDILLTLLSDNVEEFTKYTSKIGNLSLNHYVFSEEMQFSKKEFVGIRKMPESNEHPLINVTVTTASLSNYYKRLGITYKADPKRTISELDVTIQNIEIILNFEYIMHFIPPFEGLIKRKCSIKYPEEQQQQRNAATHVIAAHQLPLIYFQCGGITVYFPLDNFEESVTVLIWRVNKINITPNLKNPLQRYPLRPDVYAKATELRLLSLRGSLIEDRQYELTFENMSAVSGNWASILRHKYFKPYAMHTNPAVEWNNPEPKYTFEFNEIYKNFTMTVTYAPHIVYKNVLICGAAIEFNCTSDLVATINTNQINMLSCHLRELHQVFKFIESVCNETNSQMDSSRSDSLIYLRKSDSSVNLRYSKSQNVLMPTTSRDLQAVLKSRQSVEVIDDDVEKQTYADSGIQVESVNSERIQSSNLQKLKRHYSSLPASTDTSIFDNLPEYKPLQLDNVKRNVPHSLSLVAGVFVINVYHSERNQRSANYATGVANQPLLSISIMQPSFMFNQNIFDSTLNFSVFNFVVQLPSADSATTFPIAVIDTAPAELEPTGTTPVLFNYKLFHSKYQLREMYINFGKSLVINMNEYYGMELCRNLLTIYTSLKKYTCVSIPPEVPLVHQVKLKRFKNYTMDVDRLHCNVYSIVLKFIDEKYDCQLVFSNLKLLLKYSKQVDKCSVRASFGSIYLRTAKKMFIHPISMKAYMDITNERWKRLPIIQSSIKFNVIQLDVGVYELLQLRETWWVLQRIINYVSKELKILQKPQSDSTHTIGHKRFLHTFSDVLHEPLVRPHLYPSRNQFLDRRKHSSHNEYYQDDLRAGAFQFVELSTDAALPHPYQIQIIKKSHGIICWRYPHPRRITKLFICPIPLATDYPMHIKCCLEYYSEVHECFLHYSNFHLTDAFQKDIDLPERSICASTWRVKILQSLVTVNRNCFYSMQDNSNGQQSHEDTARIENIINDSKDFDSIGSDFVLHPKTLVGCMRVDTVFESNSIPNLQLLISCNKFYIKMLNQPEQSSELPPLLRNFRLAANNQSKRSQAFLTFVITKFNLYGIFYSPRHYSLDCQLNGSINCLDYGYLLMLPLMEECQMHGYLQMNDEENTRNLNLVCDRVHLNLGPAVMHSLITAKYHWEEQFDLDEQRLCHALLPKCIIANRTMSSICFGQTATREIIQLEAGECCRYAFCSHYHKQQLTFQFPNEELSASIAIPLKFAEEHQTRYLVLGDKCLVLKFRKLTNFQIILVIEGQLEMISMLPHNLLVEFYADNNKLLPEDKSNSDEYKIERNKRHSICLNVNRNANLSFRFKLEDDNMRLFTRNIPLIVNKKLPWMVKVPAYNMEFLSCWVRILREDIAKVDMPNLKPQRILITIWPIFEITSMLNCSASAKDKASNTDYSLVGKGGKTALDLPATNATEHYINFEYSFPVVDDDNMKCYNLSLKSLDWRRFFWYDDEEWTVDQASKHLQKPIKNYWPFNSEDEQRVKRSSRGNSLVDVTYNVERSRDFSCTLNLQLAPWGIFINSTGHNICLTDLNSDYVLPIDSNCMEMLRSLANGFYIQIPNGSGWKQSLPLYFEDSPVLTKKSKQYYTLSATASACDICILIDGVIFRFILELKIENNFRTLKLSSKYVVVNFTKSRLSLLPFVVDEQFTATEYRIRQLAREVQQFDVKTVPSWQDPIGISLSQFYNVSDQCCSKTPATNYLYYVSIKLNDEPDSCMPVPLNTPFKRHCINIPKASEGVAYVLTLMEWNNIYYLSISEDLYPAIVINNETETNFIVGQTFATADNLQEVKCDYENAHLRWHQRVPQSSKCYYTPPFSYANFPKVESRMCNIVLALAMTDTADSNTSIKWSKPISLDKSYKSYLRIPDYGDVQIIVCNKHSIIRLNILYLSQQMEFYANDVRSRFPTSCDDHDTNFYAVSSEIESVVETRIKDYNDEEMSQKTCQHFKKHTQTQMNQLPSTVQCRLFIKEIEFHLHIDDCDAQHLKREVIGLFMDDFVLAYQDGTGERLLNIFIANLQIDNQLYSTNNYDFPVVVCSNDLYERKANPIPTAYNLQQFFTRLEPRNLMLRFNFVLYDDECKIRSLQCSINPLRMYIEDAFINDLFDALVECYPVNCAYKRVLKYERRKLHDNQVVVPTNVAAEVLCLTEPIQLQSFRIERVNVILTVHKSVRLYIALDHSPLSFSAYQCNHLLTLPINLGQSLGVRYLSDAIFGAGWVLGSLEILGNPGGLARSVTAGVIDFISLPVIGLLRGPWGFIMGVTQGSASLFRNITAGTVNSVTKLAASVARNLDRLTLDNEHIERTESLRRCRPQGFAEGFYQGVTGLGISLLGAVGGLAHHTLHAGSPSEVFTGVGKGLVGAVTKPISGAAELLAIAGRGVLQTVGFNALPQVRSPSTCRNIFNEISPYRLWSLLPAAIKSDQILFNHDITIMNRHEMKAGYVFLTSMIIAIIEADSENLKFAYPIDKVNLSVDVDDPTLFFVFLKNSNEYLEEEMNYTNERIVNFLQSSSTRINTDTLCDLLQDSTRPVHNSNHRTTDCTFYINEHIGKHLISYLNILYSKHLGS